MTADHSSFEKTPLNTVKRLPKRGHYDRETVYQILDSQFLCHVAFVQDNQPFIIPTLYARDDDRILLHGASTSRMLAHAQTGQNLCIAVTCVDALVLARSIFHHSINYRSVVVFGRGTPVENPDEKMRALTRFTEMLLPGRWQNARPPNPVEMKATSVIAVTIESASAKIRDMPPGDDEEDLTLPVWSGLLPIQMVMGTPIPAPDASPDVPLPDYIRDFIAAQNGGK